MASATSSPPARSKGNADGRIPEARTLAAPLRKLAHTRRVAPLLYFELTGLDALGKASSSRVHEQCRHAVSGALRSAIGSLLRRNDAVVEGPNARWYAALLLDRAVAARARDAVIDADLGIAAGRLRAAIQSRIDTRAGRKDDDDARIGVRAGWTIIEPRDPERPLAELRHALRGAAVVARVEERRATVFAAITHELRTPLTSILGYAEQLASGMWADQRKRAKALDIVADESRRLARLVEGLIDAGAWQAGRLVLRRRPVALHEIATRAAATVTDAAKARGVRVVLRGKATALVDPDRLMQVLVNLLDNGVRHARQKGIVRVSIAQRPSRRSVVVTDDGPGFAPGAMRSLGSPFAVGRNGRTGLGLAISKMLVEAHDGALEFGATKTGGARVTVLLPSA
jgi:signal transduction histidine kinase